MAHICCVLIISPFTKHKYTNRMQSMYEYMYALHTPACISKRLQVGLRSLAHYKVTIKSSCSTRWAGRVAQQMPCLRNAFERNVRENSQMAVNMFQHVLMVKFVSFVYFLRFSGVHALHTTRHTTPHVTSRVRAI